MAEIPSGFYKNIFYPISKVSTYRCPQRSTSKPYQVPTMYFTESSAQLDPNNVMVFSLPTVLCCRVAVQRGKKTLQSVQTSFPSPAWLLLPPDRIAGLGGGLCSQWGEVRRPGVGGGLCSQQREVRRHLGA